jgi:hypothetical protein
VSDAAPTIELLWWEGCPSTAEALADLRAAMSDAGLDPESVDIRRIASEAEAARAEFVGSPTIRVDGADPLPPPPDEPTGLTCRIYWTTSGRPSPTPDPHLLRAALAALIGTNAKESQG